MRPPEYVIQCLLDTLLEMTVNVTDLLMGPHCLLTPLPNQADAFRVKNALEQQVLYLPPSACISH